MIRNLCVEIVKKAVEKNVLKNMALFKLCLCNLWGLCVIESLWGFL